MEKRVDAKIDIKKVALFVLALLPVAAIGGYFTGIYGFEEVAPELQSQILEQIGSKELYYLIGALQTCLYAVVFGALGYILAQKLGLMKPFAIEKKPAVIALGFAVFCGLILSLDIVLFGRLIPQVGQMYEQRPSLPYWIASVTYGGVVEEVMMRLFVMSLIAFIMWKLFFRKQLNVPVSVLVIANVAAALLFAAGHLPATMQMFGEITPLILFRCFLLNSVAGICFGYLYRKYGIQYAMMAHAGAHVVWKVIWVAAIIVIFMV